MARALAVVCCLALVAAAAAADCGIVPVVVNGYFAGVTLPVADGTTLTATCNFLYTSTPVPTATCTGGAWVLANGACQKVCGAPPPLPSNANFQWPADCASTPQLGWCTATCPPGLYGGPTAQCLGTAWDGVLGQCRPGGVCHGQPGASPKNAVWKKCQDTPIGEYCEATCNAGFDPLGGVAPSVACVADASKGTKGRWADSVVGECIDNGGMPGAGSGGR